MINNYIIISDKSLNKNTLRKIYNKYFLKITFSALDARIL